MCRFMANKMVRFPSSPFYPKPSQTFTVGSISWLINDNGDGEIIELVQNSTASITPAPALVDPISEPPLRSSSSVTRRSLPHYPRKQIDNDDLIASINQVNQKLSNCLSIAESALVRPADDEEFSPRPHRRTTCSDHSIHSRCRSGPRSPSSSP